MGKLEVWNAALAHVSNARLASVDDEGDAADACRSLWPVIHDQILSYARWDHATKRVVLEPPQIQGGTVPAGWTTEQLISLPDHFREIPYRWVIDLVYQDEVGREAIRSLLAAAGAEADFIAAGGRLNAPIDYSPIRLDVLETLHAPVRVTPLQQDRRIELVWGRVNGATDYNVRWREGATGNWLTIVGTDGFNELDFDNLQNGVLYQFQVMAKNSEGISRWSGSANGIPVGPPDAQRLPPPVPVGLRGEPLDAQVMLTWREIPTATGYQYRYRIGGQWSEAIDSPNGDRPEAIVTMLDNATRYEFQIRAVNQYGRSDWSDSAFVIPASQAPELPRSLRAKGLNMRAQFSWLRSRGATDYDVRYRLSTDVVWVRIENTSITHPPEAEADDNFRVAIIIPNLQNGQEYQFSVRASNDNGESLYSGHVTATPQASRTPTIARLEAEAGDAEVTLEHEAIQGAINYHYRYRKALPNQRWEEVQSGVTSTVFTIRGLDNGIRYEFQARAEKRSTEGGTGLWSSSVTASPEAALQSPGTTNLRCLAGERQVQLIWTLAARADFYQYRRGPSPGDWGAWIYAGGPGATRRPVTDLENGTPVYFQVRGVNSASQPYGPESDVCAATPERAGTAPMVPERVRCTPDDSEVELTWRGSANAEDYNWEWELLDANGNPLSTRGDYGAGDTGTRARIAGLSNNRRYRFRVQAYNSFGGSGWSDWVECIPRTSRPRATHMNPATCGDGYAETSWRDVPGAESYEVYRSSSSRTPPSNDDVRSGDRRFDGIAGTAYRDTSAQNGNLYYYWARVRNQEGPGPWSNRVSCRPEADIVAPPVPANLEAEGQNNQARTTWNDVEGEDSFDIAYNTSGSRPANVDQPQGVEIVKVGANATSRTITGLRNGTTYYFWIRSRLQGERSAWSSVASAQPGVAPLAPSLNSFTGSWAVFWNHRENATRYRIEWSVMRAGQPDHSAGSFGAVEGSSIEEVDPASIVTGQTIGFQFPLGELEAGTRYTVRARSENFQFGNSGWDYLSITPVGRHPADTVPRPPQVPANVRLLAYRNDADYRIACIWDETEETISRYVVEFAELIGGSWQQATESGGAGSSNAHPNLRQGDLAGKTYRARVRAERGTLSSAFSDFAQLTVPELETGDVPNDVLRYVFGINP